MKRFMILLFGLIYLQISFSQTSNEEVKEVLIMEQFDNYNKTINGLYIFETNKEPIKIDLPYGEFEQIRLVVLYEINKLYKDGWRLISVTPTGDGMYERIYFFERIKNE